MGSRTYENESIRVLWDSSRCIHTARCVRGLPGVFDPTRRPWIELSGAEADRVAEVVERCPTGALRYERLDGGAEETPASPTRVIPTDDGPLVVRGRVRVLDGDGGLIGEETRLTLCRCGQSANQPFCDNSHREAGFRSGEPEPFEGARRGEPGEVTELVATSDGPLRLRGDLRVETPDGNVLGEATQLFLCRCGQSSSKPLCDSSHQTAGFSSEEPETSGERLAADSPQAFEPNRQIDC